MLYGNHCCCSARLSSCKAVPVVHTTVAHVNRAVRANIITQQGPLRPAVLAAAASSTGGGGVGSGGPAGTGGSGGSSGGSSGGAGGSGGSGQPHPMRVPTFLLAALLAVGGAMGFVKGRSSKSLGGGLSGALILALAANSMVGLTAQASVRVAFAITLLLGMFFVSRFTRTRKVFPAGVGAAVSLGYAAAYVALGL